MAERVAGDGTLVVVEGTKQYLAAVTAARRLDLAVVGVAGCWGWMSDGNPISDLGEISWARPVVVIFDADVASNPEVHEAARRFGEELTMRGAKTVRFARLPDGGTSGLDDVLVSRAGRGSTATVFDGIVRAAGKLP